MQANELQSQILIVRLSLLELQKELLAYLKDQFDKENGRVSQPAEWLQVIMISERFHWMKELTSLIIDTDVLSELEEISEDNASIIASEVERILIGNNEARSDFNKHYKLLLKGGAPLLENLSRLRSAHQKLPVKTWPDSEALRIRGLWHEEHRQQSRKRRN